MISSMVENALLVDPLESGSPSLSDVKADWNCLFIHAPRQSLAPVCISEDSHKIFFSYFSTKKACGYSLPIH